MQLARRILFSILLLAILFFAGAWSVYETIPRRNTDQSHFDAIIVLGCPANPDGTPSLTQRERVTEGVVEYRRGVAPHLIVTGGPAHNQYVEADVMARFAETEGVPADAVLEEARAHDTIQNAFYSVQIMQTHGWHSAEIVSSPSHLARASLIFAHFPIRFRTQRSAFSNDFDEAAAYWREIRYSDKLRLLGFKPSPYLPASR